MLNKKVSVIILVFAIIIFSFTSNCFADTQSFVFDFSNYSDGEIVLYNNAFNLVVSDASSRGIDIYNRPYTVVVYPDRMLFYSCNIGIHTYAGDNKNYYYTSGLDSNGGGVYIWNIAFNNNSPSIADFVNLWCYGQPDWTLANSDSYILASSQDVYDYINNINITGLKTLNQMYSQRFFSSSDDNAFNDHTYSGNSGTNGGSTTGGSSSSTTIDYTSGGVFSWIAQGFNNVVGAITQGLSSLVSILDYLNPFSDNFILKSVIDFLGNILNYLNPFSDKFFGYKIIELLGDLLKALFIPSPERFTALQNVFTSKFEFIDSIKYAIQALENIFNNLGNTPKLVIHMNNQYVNGDVTILDMSWYAPYKTYGDLILTGFIYAFFLWRMFITLPSTIAGNGGIFMIDSDVSSITAQIDDIKAYQRFGFGRGRSDKFNSRGHRL